MQTQTINISLPRPVVIQVDLMAKQMYATRSGLIRQALLEKIRRWQSWEDIFTYGRKQARKVGIKSEAAVDRMVYQFRHGKKTA